MQCLSCGAQLNEDNPECPHCDSIPEENKPASPNPLNMPGEATATSLPYRQLYRDSDQPAMPYPAPLYQADQTGPYPPLLPYATPANPPAPRNKKKLVTIIALASIATIVILALVFGIFYSITLSTLEAQKLDPNSLSSLQNLHMKNGATSRWNPYTQQQETLVLQDSLEDNSTSLEYNYHWLDEDTDTDGGASNNCHFTNHSYHTYIDTKKSAAGEAYCLAAGTQFSNFTYQVDMTLTQGDLGGFIFRENTHSRFYVFMISSHSNYLFASSAGSDAKILARGTSLAIHPGLNQINRLAVVALGSKLDLYVNEHLITSVKDATYTTGRIGMIVIGDKKHNVDAGFSNAKVWQHP